jgi:hypothetical protein
MQASRSAKPLPDSSRHLVLNNICSIMLILTREHLYRRHLLPPQCHRCCITFANDVTLREHQRDPRGCEVNEQIPLEGFDKDQERRLKSKKRSQTYQTEEEKWKGVYRILFPDDGEADIPIPYIEYQPCTGQTAEPSNIASFQEFSRLELPRLVRRTLEVIIEQEAQPLEEKMKERLVDVVKECQNHLVSMFQSISGPSTESITFSELQSTARYSVRSYDQIAAPPVELKAVAWPDFQMISEDFGDARGYTPNLNVVESDIPSLQSFQMETPASAHQPPSTVSTFEGSNSGCNSLWPTADILPSIRYGHTDSQSSHDCLPFDEYYRLVCDQSAPTTLDVLGAGITNIDISPNTWSSFEQYLGRHEDV